MTSALERLGARVAAEHDRALDGESLPSSDTLLAGIQRRRTRARSRSRVAGVTALAGTAIVAFGSFFLLRPATGASIRPAARTVIASTTTHDDAPRARFFGPSLGEKRADAAHVPLLFQDGTTITVQRGGVASLESVREHGATISLHEGTLEVDVVHTDTSRWNVEAGPFGILVTGTRFDASYDAVKRQLTVAMAEGTVQVSGPCVNESLTAPNRKVFECASTKASAEPSTSAETPEKLLATADAARLAGDGTLARQLYTKIRDRFPRTPAAAKSAFLLGRSAQSSGAVDDAVHWFDIAWQEKGDFAQEALGRLVEIEQRRGNADRARVRAAEYLQSYPRGAHAAYASSVMEARH